MPNTSVKPQPSVTTKTHTALPSNPLLQKMLRRELLWQARTHASEASGVATGFLSLDQALHQGGWPREGLIELLSQQCGIGELSLILPAINTLQAHGRYIVLVNTPYTPYLPSLAHAGICPEQLLVIKPLALAPLLWTLEQSLRSNACAAVVCWLAEKNLRNSALRKLQLAAQSGSCPLFLYRHSNIATQHSPAKLRLKLSKQQQQLHIEVLKQPTGWAGQHITIVQAQHAQQWRSATQLPVLTSADFKSKNDRLQADDYGLNNAKLNRLHA